jgi:hypothetical protein
MQVVDSISTNYNGLDLIVPYPGNFVYPLDHGVANITNLSTKQKAAMIFYNAIGYQKLSMLSGTSNQWISYTLTMVDGTTATIYDWSTNTTIYAKKTPAPGTGQSPYLADDGRFVLFSPSFQVDKISGSTLQLVGTLSNPGTFVSFRPDNTDEMIFSSFGKISIYNSNDLTLSRTIAAPGVSSAFVNYDPVSHNLLFEERYTNVIYLVNIDTQQLKTVRAVSGNRLVNGILFSLNDYYLKVL